MWEKISTLRQTNNAIKMYVTNPHSKKPSQSEKLVHLVSSNELRIGQPEQILMDRNNVKKPM